MGAIGETCRLVGFVLQCITAPVPWYQAPVNSWNEQPLYTLQPLQPLTTPWGQPLQGYAPDSQPYAQDGEDDE